jgi:DNA-directed RNA polymerase subunit H (RpoH/RPB5)
MDGKINYPPLEVYKNLHHLLRHRYLELVSGSYVTELSERVRRYKPEKQLDIFETIPRDSNIETPSAEPDEIPTTAKPVPKRIGTWLPDKEFVDLIQWERYCIVEARDLAVKDRRYPRTSDYCKTVKTKTFIVILDKSYDVDSAGMTKIMNKLPDIKSLTRKFNMDIIIISENPITIFASKKMLQYASSGSDTAGYVFPCNELYTVFIFDITTRESSASHRILTLAEEQQVLQELNVPKHALQKISYRDAHAMILGAVPGDLVELITFNENTADDLHYRVVRI